jgi:hypothetical protein
MQVVTDAKCNGLQPWARHPIHSALLRLPLGFFHCLRSSLRSAAIPLANSVGVGGMIAASCDCEVLRVGFPGNAQTSVFGPAGYAKRNDGWKNMRNSSLSIA